VPKKLVEKILTHDLRQWHWETTGPHTRRIVRGPVLAQCIGWDAADAFLRLQGTALIYNTIKDPYDGSVFRMVTFPPGWEGDCMNMENLFEEELWPTA
jgi:hypothetical protein